MKKSILQILIPIMLWASCSAPPIEQSIAYSVKNELWSSLRKSFNYHIQQIGLSKHFEDESCLFIISEPSPNTSVEELQRLLEDYNIFTEIKEHKVGYDGWVKDLIIAVNDVDAEDIADISDILHQYLFKTTYKSYNIKLPIDNEFNPYLVENLNYQISVNELEKWFISDAEKFHKDNEQLSITVENILSNKKEGVFFSNEHGFVIWAIKTNSSISNKQEEIRKFTLDSDLILGAISKNNMLVIIGRERQSSIIDLPPLRLETILLLASANNEELSQSYERNTLFAGKLPGGKDWAPIYLSDELQNTEYGSLLNITDQMLKSWSLNGDVEYIDFPYLKPDYYAFKNGVMETLNVNELSV